MRKMTGGIRERDWRERKRCRTWAAIKIRGHKGVRERECKS